MSGHYEPTTAPDGRHYGVWVSDPPTAEQLAMRERAMRPSAWERELSETLPQSDERRDAWMAETRDRLATMTPARRPSLVARVLAFVTGRRQIGGA